MAKGKKRSSDSNKNTGKSSAKRTAAKRFERIFPWSIIAAGVIGLAASFALAVETVNYIRDPQASLSCSINPIVNCSSVIDTPQGEVLGFMNPLIGVIGFSMLIVFGLAVFYGAKFPALIWQGAQAVSVLGLGFVHWLIYSSIYSLGSLCPYCMVVWLVTIMIAMQVTIRNINHGVFGGNPTIKRIGMHLACNNGLYLIVWYALIAALIIQHFGIDSLTA